MGGRRPTLPGQTGQLVGPAPSIGSQSSTGQVGRGPVPSTQAGICPSPAGPAVYLQDQGQQQALGSNPQGLHRPGGWGLSGVCTAGGGPQDSHPGLYTTRPCLTRRTARSQRARGVWWPVSSLLPKTEGWPFRAAPGRLSRAACSRAPAWPSSPRGPLPWKAREQGCPLQGCPGEGRPGVTDPQLPPERDP